VHKPVLSLTCARGGEQVEQRCLTGDDAGNDASPSYTPLSSGEVRAAAAAFCSAVLVRKMRFAAKAQQCEPCELVARRGCRVSWWRAAAAV
jgi:hypothetical protein